MARNLEQLIEKSSGQLIRSIDWNDLVHNVIDLNTTLVAKLEKATGDITALQEDNKKIRQDFTDYQNRINPIVSQFYSVSIQTTKASYSIGELAIIEVKVSDPLGGAINDPAVGLPWVDFIATWGQLKAAPGFNSLAGDGDRAISVQANSSGVARAFLSSDHTSGFSDTEADEIVSALNTQLPNTNLTIAAQMVASANPLEFKQQGGFNLITQAYDRPEADAVRRYTDAYYVKYAPEIAQLYTPKRTSWHDYRATVLAVVRSGEPAGTPQRRHGVESIQVTFRDWITPWINMEYLDDARLKDMVDEARNRFVAKIDDDYKKTNDLIRKEVIDNVKKPNLISKLRDWRVVESALDGLTVNNPPPFLTTLVDSVKQGVQMQQSLEIAQATSISTTPTNNVAFSVFTEAATRSDTNINSVVGQVNALQQLVVKNGENLNAIEGTVGTLNTSVGKFDQRLSDVLGETGSLTRLQTGFETLNQSMGVLQNSVGVVNTKVEQAFAQGGDLGNLHNDVTTLKGQLAGLQQLNPSDVTSKLSEFKGLSNRLSAIEQRIG